MVARHVWAGEPQLAGPNGEPCDPQHTILHMVSIPGCIQLSSLWRSGSLSMVRLLVARPTPWQGRPITTVTVAQGLTHRLPQVLQLMEPGMQPRQGVHLHPHG